VSSNRQHSRSKTGWLSVSVTPADKLRDALHPELLWSYFGADEDDQEAVAFIEELQVEPVLIEDTASAESAVEALEAEKSPFIGLDIETSPKPEYAEPRPPVQINADGSVGLTRAPKHKSHLHAGVDPHRAALATLQLFAGGMRCFVFRGEAIDRVLSSPWFSKQNFIAHSATFEAGFLHQRGVHVNIGCTLQAGGLCYGVGFGGERRSLANISAEVLGLTPPKALQTSDWGAARLSYGQICYGASDAVIAYRLWPRLRAEMVTHQRTGAYLLQRRAVPAVAAMESRGLGIDLEEHARQCEGWALRLANARRNFFGTTGDPPPTNDNEVREWMIRVTPPDELRAWPRTAKTGALSVQGKHLKRLLHIRGIPAGRVVQAMR